MRALLAILAVACTPRPAPEAGAWIQSPHILSVWPLDEETRQRFGVDINGTWAEDDAASIAARQARGERVVVSVQVLAGEAELLAEHPELGAAISRDVFGQEALVLWYDWLTEPVVVLSIVSPVFREYLVDRGKQAVDAGADGWFIDEIQTSALLVSAERHGAGFAPFETEAYVGATGQPSLAAHVEATFGVRIPDEWDAADVVRDGPPALRDRFLADYRRFHEDLALRLMSEVIAEVRAYAAARGRPIAIGANLAGLGARTDWSRLSSPIWTRSLDFLLFEHDPPSLQASFAPYYQLGRATVPGFVAAMPGLELAERVAARSGYLGMAFSEAVAFEGSWGLGYWWEEMGWEEDALLPAELERYTRFVREHHALYEGARARQSVAVVYPQAEVLREPRVHHDFIALCETLLARHVPFDVVYQADAPTDAGGYTTVLWPGQPPPADLPGIDAPAGVLTALYRREGETLLHLVNRRYDEGRDVVLPLEDVEIALPAGAEIEAVHWLAPGRAPIWLGAESVGGRLRFVVPSLETYGVAVLSRRARSAPSSAKWRSEHSRS